MVYMNYILKPRLENKQFFFNTLNLYSPQKIELNCEPWAKNDIFPPLHDEILTTNHSEKQRSSINRQIKKGQTAKLPDYNRPPWCFSFYPQGLRFIPLLCRNLCDLVYGKADAAFHLYMIGK